MKQRSNRSLEVFTVVRIQVEVFSVVTPWNVAVEYQRSRGACCLHLQGELVAISLQHYTASQLKRPRLATFG